VKPIKPFSQACENNRKPICTILREAFSGQRNVLEIGSGTGQHAVYFGRELPHLLWQTSDIIDNAAGINLWINEQGPANVQRPLTIDVCKDWPYTGLLNHFNGVFSANTCHIMPWKGVEAFLGGLEKSPSGTRFALYGPFKYGGEYTSTSNQRFDHWLKAQDPGQGIRDFESINSLATNSGFSLLEDHPMPANNQLILWQK